MKNRKEFNLLIWIAVQVYLFYLLLCLVCFHGSKSLFKRISTDLGSCFIICFIKKEQKLLYYVNDVESFQVLCMLFILSMQCDRDSVYQWVLQGKTEQPTHSDCDTSDEWVRISIHSQQLPHSQLIVAIMTLHSLNHWGFSLQLFYYRIFIISFHYSFSIIGF